jgi:hypothetical protein
MSYFTLGKFPRSDVEATARLLVKYRRAKLTGPEFGEMFFRLVDKPDVVIDRANEIERDEDK